MPLTILESISLIIIFIYLAALCVNAVIKSPQSSQGCFVWALVIGLALIQLSFDQEHYDSLMQEDGPVEWATFYAFFFAGFSFIKRAWQQRFSSGRLQILSLFLIGIFCFFVGGEEISWAQRFFAFKPPEFLLEHNFQMEANVHNILKDKSLAGLSLDSKNLVALIAFIFGVLLPLIGRIYPRAIKPIVAAVPDLRFTGFFLLVAWAEWTYPIDFTGEAAELYLGCLFFLSQRVLPRRRNHFIMAAIFFLGISTPIAANRINFDNSEANAVIAHKELQQLGFDLMLPDVLQDKLFKKSSIHKRIFTAEKVGYFKLRENNQFLEGQASALGVNGRKDRIGFYLDPWNNPYWIKWIRRKRQLVIYSFGPNRKRDLSLDPRIDIRPDDIALTFRVPKNY
jgi:hypothetical protein